MRCETCLFFISLKAPVLAKFFLKPFSRCRQYGNIKTWVKLIKSQINRSCNLF